MVPKRSVQETTQILSESKYSFLNTSTCPHTYIIGQPRPSTHRTSPNGTSAFSTRKEPRTANVKRSTPLRRTSPSLFPPAAFHQPHTTRGRLFFRAPVYSSTYLDIFTDGCNATPKPYLSTCRVLWQGTRSCQYMPMHSCNDLFHSSTDLRHATHLHLFLSQK